MIRITRIWDRVNCELVLRMNWTVSVIRKTGISVVHSTTFIFIYYWNNSKQFPHRLLQASVWNFLFYNIDILTQMLYSLYYSLKVPFSILLVVAKRSLQLFQTIVTRWFSVTVSWCFHLIRNLSINILHPLYYQLSCMTLSFTFYILLRHGNALWKFPFLILLPLLQYLISIYYIRSVEISHRWLGHACPLDFVTYLFLYSSFPPHNGV